VTDELPFEEYEEGNGSRPKTQEEIDLEQIEELLFPHTEIRLIQDALIKKIDECIQSKLHLVAHAPTGLGKTAAALSPTLTHAIKKKNLVILFLTSRHTQHKIVIETLNKINSKFNLNIKSVSVIGKKHLCLQPNVESFYGKDFAEYCRILKEDGKCEFYTNLKSKDKLSADTENAISTINRASRGVATTEAIIECSRDSNVCPYEVSILLAKNAKVIITDYQYMFNTDIRNGFFKKINKELKDCIIIIDEAHNLPGRVKDLSSEYLSTIMLKRAITEAKKFKYDEIANALEELHAILEGYAKSLSPELATRLQRNSVATKSVTGNASLEAFQSAATLGTTDKKDFKDLITSEKYIAKEDFVMRVEKIKEYQELIAELEFAGSAIREEQKMSYVASIALFLEAWLGQDNGFTRIVHSKKFKDGVMVTLSYRCLDPSIVTAPVMKESYSTMMMSGTLTPTAMYRELVGIEAEELTLKSPFPEENRCNIIIPKTSTKYEARNVEQYKAIAEVLLDLAQTIPGCMAVYFPSYYLMGEIVKFFETKTQKSVFIEHPDMTKSDKQEFLERFKTYKEKGAVLLAVIGGNFAEGIDMPGILKGVVIVGLPLQRPDLETKALIEYYDKKFGKGWDYGYLFPAFTKTIQAAGRCIRSEKDKGIIIFLDERYSWNNYYRCFPASWTMKISLLYKDMIKKFFENNALIKKVPPSEPSDANSNR